MKAETTTIQISTTTRDRIKANGLMGDDYEAVIIKALEALEKSKKTKEAKT